MDAMENPGDAQCEAQGEEGEHKDNQENGQPNVADGDNLVAMDQIGESEGDL